MRKLSSSWTVGEHEVRVSFDRAEVRPSLERWLEDWSEGSELPAHDGTSSLTIPFSLWTFAGEAPARGESPEAADLFASQHSALSELFGIETQVVRIESVGHVGSPELSLLFVVNGIRLVDAAAPTPFAVDGSGRRHALMAVAFVAYDRICRFNARGQSTRAEQLVFVSELRSHFERSSSSLENAKARFRFEFDEHLNAFRVQHTSAASLAWVPQKNGVVFDLQLTHVGSSGAREPLDLNRLDASAPIIELSSTEHILLPQDVAAVARVAKTQRNKLRKHAELHFNDPSSLIPEGLVLENVDLSAYSPRVVGFAPIIKAERAFDIQSTGVAWYQTDEAGHPNEPFLQLLVSQPGGGEVEALEIATPEVAEKLALRLEAELSKSSPAVVDLAGKRVLPTRALLDRLHQYLHDYRSKEVPFAAEVIPATSGRVAAVISDDSSAAAVVEASVPPVPWSTLERLLAPGVVLKAHQRTAIDWLWRMREQGAHGVLLADDMGLGKTLQIAAFLALRRAVDPEMTSPDLVACPVILLENWQAELRRFFRPEVFQGTKLLYGDELRRLRRGNSLDITGLGAACCVLTNYETLQAHQQSLLRVDWNTVVLDEAQAIKNPDTYRARSARGLKRAFGICSTGTPVENRLSDLWALYDFLSPGNPFTSIKEFEQNYEAELEAGIQAVRQLLRFPGRDSSLLRRTKSEVLDLPPKAVEMHPIAMTPKQVELERQIVRAGTKKGNALALLQDLQKLYQHPLLLVPDSERSVDWSVGAALRESPKLLRCVELLRTIQSRGEKALVFTMWTRMQDLLVEVFKQELGLQRVRVINGETRQRRNAHRNVDEFSKQDGFDVLILSPLAAGTGLTITAANHVIHYGRWWNPAKEDQATDRAYRIGQTRPVSVHYPLLHHPGREDLGFDIKLHALVEGKRSTARDFLAPQSEEVITMDDIAMLQGE